MGNFLMVLAYIAAIALAVGGVVLFVKRQFAEKFSRPSYGEETPKSKPNTRGNAILLAGMLLGAFALFFVGASLINVGKHDVGHLSRKLGGRSMEQGQILATSDQNGNQLRILAPGLQFVPWVNITHDVKYLPAVEIPEGKYARLKARAGSPLGSRAFAEAFAAADHDKMITDASFFIENGGTKGPQTSVLTPGVHRFNQYLWEYDLDDATIVPKGFVAVITSAVHGPVNFGPNFQFAKPADTSPIIIGGVGGALKAELVPVGAVGVWEKALPPGTYYINRKAYDVRLVDTRVQTWEYKGGYTARSVELTVAEDGSIKQEPKTEKVEVPQGAADKAVFPFVEGHEVPQELRVMVQVPAENAPFTVAAVGDNLQDIENKIMTPVIREVVRNVIGGGKITLMEPADPELAEAADDTTEIEMVEVTREVRVLDLINHREALVAQIEAKIRPEGKKAGVEIKEVRLGHSAIPPEVTLPRRMEQLAVQLKESFTQQRIAQQERIASEHARAEANQQEELVKADIALQAAELTKTALKHQGEGERSLLEQRAAGQKAQMQVLGEERVMELEKFNKLLELYRENPELLVKMLENAHKLVPETLIQMGDGGGGGLGDAAAIYGSLMKGLTVAPTTQAPAASGSGK